MSVKSTHEMCCPKCGDDSEIVVTFTGTCKLVSDGTEDCGDHEWDDDSYVRCDACGHESTVTFFRVQSP